VLAVGDLHAENFGTWRDAEGRLAWGVNDFDEAAELPYTNDLVRLATSALLASAADHLSVGSKDVCDAILAGYVQGIEAGGKPFVIDEENRWFIDVIAAKTADPVKFWQKARQVVEAAGHDGKAQIPAAAAAALSAALSAGATDVKMAPRCAGVGSLGRPRFVALANWLGGPILREVKALVPSAVPWAQGDPGAGRAHAAEAGCAGGDGAGSCIPRLVGAAVAAGLRCPDPFFHVAGGWVGRRLAPDSHKIELKSSAKTGYGVDLLGAMGREAANVHLATASAAGRIRDDLKSRGNKWLRDAAKVMRDVTVEEQKQWVKTKP
jgi:hypothetical protein